MSREISDLEARLQRLREAHGGTAAAAPAPARRGPGRPPGRPAGSGATAAAAGQKRGPGRPPGRRGPGRPPAAATTAAATGGEAGAAKDGAKRRRRRSAITPEQLASRQLQGRYLALVRQFPERRRAEFATIAKEKGREAAIKAMQDAKK